MNAWQEILHGSMITGAAVADDFVKVLAIPTAIGIKILSDRYAPLIKKGWIIYFRKRDKKIIEIDKSELD